jgi:hypothetical protein
MKKNNFLLIILTLTIFSNPLWSQVVRQSDNANFGSIQAAIDDGDTENGDILVVAPGTYNENLLINKEITLRGNNAGVPHNGTRSDESIISITVPTTSDRGIEITADNVSLDGFEIQSTFSDGGSILIDIMANNASFINNVQEVNPGTGGSTAVRAQGSNNLISQNSFTWTGDLENRGDNLIGLEENSTGSRIINNDVNFGRIFGNLADGDEITIGGNDIFWDPSYTERPDYIFGGGDLSNSTILDINTNTASNGVESGNLICPVIRSTILNYWFFISEENATTFANNTNGASFTSCLPLPENISPQPLPNMGGKAFLLFGLIIVVFSIVKVGGNVKL